MLILSLGLYPHSVYAQTKTNPAIPALVFEQGNVPPMQVTVVAESPAAQVAEPPVAKAVPTPKPKPAAKRAAKATPVKKATQQKWIDGGYGGWCVTFAKNYTGYYGTWGNGGRSLPLTHTPQIGAVVVFNYTHVAVIKDIVGGRLVLIESNYYKSMHISIGRTIAINDTSIRGYFIP